VGARGVFANSAEASPAASKSRPAAKRYVSASASSEKAGERGARAPDIAAHSLSLLACPDSQRYAPCARFKVARLKDTPRETRVVNASSTGGPHSERSSGRPTAANPTPSAACPSTPPQPPTPHTLFCTLRKHDVGASACCTDCTPSLTPQLHPQLKLYTYPASKNAAKALIAAEYNGVKITQPPFEMGVTNKTPAFLKLNPLGKVRGEGGRSRNAAGRCRLTDPAARLPGSRGAAA